MKCQAGCIVAAVYARRNESVAVYDRLSIVAAVYDRRSESVAVYDRRSKSVAEKSLGIFIGIGGRRPPLQFNSAVADRRYNAIGGHGPPMAKHGRSLENPINQTPPWDCPLQAKLAIRQ
jgi:hypothetical protein